MANPITSLSLRRGWKPGTHAVTKTATSALTPAGQTSAGRTSAEPTWAKSGRTSVKRRSAAGDLTQLMEADHTSSPKRRDL